MPLTEMETTGNGTHFAVQGIENSSKDVLELWFLLDIQVEMFV